MSEDFSVHQYETGDVSRIPIGVISRFTRNFPFYLKEAKRKTPAGQIKPISIYGLVGLSVLV